MIVSTHSGFYEQGNPCVLPEMAPCQAKSENLHPKIKRELVILPKLLAYPACTSHSYFTDQACQVLQGCPALMRIKTA